MLRILFAGMLALLAPLSALPVRAQAPSADEYAERIQPIFDGRCIACHSCNNAPCQLNLQSYAGLERGAHKLNVYDRFRRTSVPPSRLHIDARSVSEWRQRGFFDVGTGTEAGAGLLMQLLALRNAHPAAQPDKPVNESKVCVADPADLPSLKTGAPELGMPYGFPPLSAAEMTTLAAWAGRGAPGPRQASAAAERFSAGVASQALAWEAWLNERSLRQRLLSRYLFEHLFLAHHYFPAEPRRFYRLVRSRTGCATGVDEIASRRPNDDPGTAGFHYCLRPVTDTIVAKTHMPYELTPAKLERIRRTFAGDWTVPSLPAYGDADAKNPFVTFASIPVRARYQFLLDDAHYQLSTFIKGPVCNGSTAVNSIQEQFFVFFLKPDADGMVVSARHARAVEDLLILPGEWGSDVRLREGVGFLRRLVRHREQYRRARADETRRLRPAGYALDDIWDGDGHNRNAVLTVFRHFDNASVVQGAAGDLSKTAFVLDYPLLERMVYNLVVNFDVHGNVGHQSLTRLYMDMIRMEAEELFLSFLPPAQRQPLRREWYRGTVLTDVKMRFVFPLVAAEQPTAVRFARGRDTKLDLVQQILFDRLPAGVRGPPDALNWKRLQMPEAGTGGAAPLSPAGLALRRVASLDQRGGGRFAQHMPDLAKVLVRSRDGSRKVYSIVHHREHANVSWIAAESIRMAPHEDTLAVREGFLGAYPNMFFVISEEQASDFADAILGISSQRDYARLVASFGVPRTDPRFWSVYDEINAHFRASEPVSFGWLDLTRYELAPASGPRT